VGGEDGRDVDVTLTAERDTHSSKPFVEVGNHRRLLLMNNELRTIAMTNEGCLVVSLGYGRKIKGG
jgi:hypothetical protein